MLIVLSPRLAQDHAAYLQQRLQSDLQAGRTGISKPMQHALLAHPSDPTFATLAAAERLAHREPRPGRWINRALQLAPGWVAPHLLATQWLWNSGHPSQALIELAAALDIDPANSRAVLCSIARFELDPVLPLAAAGRRGTEALEILAGCFEPTSSAAGQVDAAILAHSPDDASASVRQAQRLLSAGDAASAQALAERALEHAGTPAQITSACLVQARALMAMERFDEATALLQNVERKLDTPTSLVVLEAEIAAQRGDEALTVATIDRLRGLAEGDPAMTASAFMLEGALQRRLGNPASAMRAYDQAYGLTRNPSALRNIAEISRQLGNLARAVWAYGELCTTAQGNQDACNMRKTLINTQPERSREAAQPIQR
jgi:tetratricopeptide (TPR) repeat protein